MAPHLLYVAWGFPPCRGSGVHRALATANAFARAGWRVTVLTAERETFERFTGADPSLESRVDSRVSVRRIPFAWPIHETDLRTYSLLRVKLPALWAKLRVRRDKRPFPEVGYGPWRPALQRAAAEIHRADPVDLVVATANPNVTFAAAVHLHRRHRVPYVMDYRDAWTLDVFTGDRLHAPSSRAARLERRYLGGAAEVWFVNEPIRRWHASVYPAVAERMHVVSNGWDPEAIADGGATLAARDASKPVVFGYLGTISPNVPMAELLEGWNEARRDGHVAPDSRLRIAGYLGFWATPRGDAGGLLAQSDGSVEYVGPVSKTQVEAFYTGIDVAVLALGTGRYVTSGKVFEYLATGKPIVSVHDPGNAASEVLAEYPRWVPTSGLEPTSIARALGRAEGLARTDDPAMRTAALDYAAQFRRDRILGPRVEALAAMVRR